MDLAKYIGIPFVERGREMGGCDCWGLVKLFYANEFAIELPGHEDLYATTTDLAGTLGVFVDEKKRWLKVSEPAPGDVIVLLMSGYPVHVGIVIDSTRMLHIERGLDAVIERFDTALWRNRIEGFYRYVRR